MSSKIDKGSNILWVDFLANGERLANRDEQKKLVANAVKSGVTHLVVDAKIPYGQVTYPSRYALHVSEWSDGRFNVWKERDFLKEMIDEAKLRGLNVLANMDVFAEGTTASLDGKAYSQTDWQVVYYRKSERNATLSRANEGNEHTVFVNPIHPEVKNYELSILREIVSNYQIDGIVLDRCRYPNIYGDFSELSRSSFESYIGESVVEWPEDIFRMKSDGNIQSIVHGKWFKKWIEWRAQNITDFVKDAKLIVKNANPECLFSIYVGSWYPLYYNEGVNWGSRTYHPEVDWASENYHNAAYGDELDFIMTGCYYPEVTIEEARANGRPADWYSVEGAINMSLKALNKQIPVFASLYLKDYDGSQAQFEKAVRLCRQKSHGVMLFDVVYLESYGWWDGLDQALT